MRALLKLGLIATVLYYGAGYMLERSAGVQGAFQTVMKQHRAKNR